MVQGNLTDEKLGLEYYRRALEIYRENNVRSDALLLTILGNTGTEHLQKGDYAAAEPILGNAAKLARETNAGVGHTALLLSNHAGALKNLGRKDEATASYVEATTLLSDAFGEAHPETITTLTSLANHYQQIGDSARADETIRRAIAGAGEGLPEVHFITSYVHNVGGMILCEGGDTELGTELAQRSLAARRELLPADHWAISSGEGILGVCHTAAGDYELAESVLLKAYADLRRTRGDENELTLVNRQRLQDLYSVWGRPDDAVRYSSPAETLQ